MFSPGTRLNDRYLLVERIGAGGMSEVWRATDALLGRAVAVKVLAAGLLADPRLRAATWREARAAAQLSHPNVTQVHDYGEVSSPGGETAGYLVMELVPGQTLAARLAAGPIPWQEAARVARQVAAALAAAHRLGVVHRDIKPGNVMLTADGVKVLDFGIAALAGGDRGGSGPVDPGRFFFGTPEYAAPERQDPAAPAQAGSDMYSFGVLLYEMLTGRRPVAGAGSTEWPPAVPESVAELGRVCLDPDPVHRPAAAQVAARLAEVAGTGAPAAPAAAGPAAAPTPTRIELPTVPAPIRLRWRLAGAGVVVLVLLGLAALLVAALRPGDPAPPVEAGPEPTATPTAAAPTAAAEPTARADAPAPAPQTPEQQISVLERAILDAFDDGALTRDAMEDLRDEVDDLRDALDEEDPADRDEKLRDEAEDLREEIADLHADGEIDTDAAQRLLELLDPLLRR